MLRMNGSSSIEFLGAKTRVSLGDTCINISALKTSPATIDTSSTYDNRQCFAGWEWIYHLGKKCSQFLGKNSFKSSKTNA